MATEYKGRVWFPQPALDKLGDVYAACDCVVIPSDSEAFPLVMVEAWQAGKPLVCSEFQTLGEVERKYADGKELAFHIPCPPTAKDVARVAQKAVDSNGTREMLAMELGILHFSASAMVSRWEDFFYRIKREWLQRGQFGEVEAI